MSRRGSKNIGGDDYTYPPTDWVPVDLAVDPVGGVFDLRSDLGFFPRALRANTEGDVVFRCSDTPDGVDRTLTMSAGEVIIGFVTHIVKTGTTATIHVAK